MKYFFGLRKGQSSIKFEEPVSSEMPVWVAIVGDAKILIFTTRFSQNF
jgi:hypothetical protein